MGLLGFCSDRLGKVAGKLGLFECIRLATANVACKCFEDQCRSTESPIHQIPTSCIPHVPFREITSNRAANRNLKAIDVPSLERENEGPLVRL